MGFSSGSITARRFYAEHSDSFGQDDIDRLTAFSAGRQKVATADGVEVGWAGGDHQYDVDFACEKNLRGDFLRFDFRVQTDKLPADKLRAYYQIELKALAAANPSGLPSGRQKREAKEAARDRLEEEAKDGRFRKLTAVPVVWDRVTSQVWFGASAVTHVDRFVHLFEQTFGVPISPIHPTRLADISDTAGWTPTGFVPGITPQDIAWIADDRDLNWLGNEFALWLLASVAGSSDVIGDTAVMNSRTLVLECPRGQTGHTSVSHEGPTRLPECRRAIQAGKLPRSVGLTLVRANEQYELTLKADSWVVSGAKVPNFGEDEQFDDQSHKDVARLEKVRAMFGTADDLFETFMRLRSDGQLWQREVGMIRKHMGIES